MLEKALLELPSLLLLLLPEYWNGDMSSELVPLLLVCAQVLPEGRGAYRALPLMLMTPDELPNPSL